MKFKEVVISGPEALFDLPFCLDNEASPDPGPILSPCVWFDKEIG